MVPSFENWLETSKNGTTYENFFGKSSDVITLDISTNGVYGVNTVYEFMGIVNNNILNQHNHQQIYDIYVNLSEWQKNLINEVWSTGFQKKMHFQKVMTNADCMDKIGYAVVKTY